MSEAVKMNELYFIWMTHGKQYSVRNGSPGWLQIGRERGVELRMWTPELNCLEVQFWLPHWLDVWSYRSHLSSVHLHSLICHFRVLNDLIQVKCLWNREVLLYTSVHYYSESCCYCDDFVYFLLFAYIFSHVVLLFHLSIFIMWSLLVIAN